MKKLFSILTLALCSVLVSAAPAEINTTCSAEKSGTATYLVSQHTGYVNTVGTCGFSFEDCNTGQILLLNKSGYNRVVGTFYTIRVDSSNPTCGYTVTYRTSSGECSTPDLEIP